MSQLIAQNAFRIVEGRPVASSIKVAEYFGKQHKDVLESIRKLVAQKPEFDRERNFSLTQEVKQLGATTRKVPFYWMDRKGFSILAMGFTGAKALDFKCAFYDEFERMEKQLQEPATETISPVEQYVIQKSVAQRAKAISAHYQTIYRAIKARYQIPRYDQLPSSKYKDCLHFIDTLDLSVPVNPTRQPAEQIAGLDESFIQTILALLYEIRYHQRDAMVHYLRIMELTQSPMADKFCALIDNPIFAIAESELRRAGYDVRELPCYKNWVKANV